MGAAWAFVGVATVVIVTPGPDTALTIRNVLWAVAPRAWPRPRAWPSGWRCGRRRRARARPRCSWPPSRRSSPSSSPAPRTSYSWAPRRWFTRCAVVAAGTRARKAVARGAYPRRRRCARGSSTISQPQDRGLLHHAAAAVCAVLRPGLRDAAGLRPALLRDDLRLAVRLQRRGRARRRRPAPATHPPHARRGHGATLVALGVRVAAER